MADRKYVPEYRAGFLSGLRSARKLVHEMRTWRSLEMAESELNLMDKDLVRYLKAMQELRAQIAYELAGLYAMEVDSWEVREIEGDR